MIGPTRIQVAYQIIPFNIRDAGSFQDFDDYLKVLVGTSIMGRLLAWRRTTRERIIQAMSNGGPTRGGLAMSQRLLPGD